MKENESEYLGQKFLPIAKTIGELREQIKELPDDIPFGFLNQPRQQIAIREYSDGSKFAVFNGLENILEVKGLRRLDELHQPRQQIDKEIINQMNGLPDWKGLLF